MSIIAAYIFYIFINFIPDLKRKIFEVSSEIVLYRKLQLMIVSLDSIFILAYKKHFKDKKINHDIGLTLKEFYNKDTMEQILQDFDLNQESNMSSVNGKLICRQEIFIHWQDTCKLIGDINGNPVIHKHLDLYYELNYLKNDSSIAIYFESLKIRKNIDPICILSLNQKDTSFCENNFNSIIAVHQIANKMYTKLKNKDSQQKTIYEPLFYKNKSKKDEH